VVALGTVETPYWQNNPGSRENLPQTDPRLVPVLTPEQAAEAIVDGVEQKKRFVVKPGIFRALFVLNALFPRLVARELSRSAKKPSA
jgi:short-subunit dehydrogenase